MQHLLFTFLTVCLLAGFAAPSIAQNGKIVQCGIPDDVHVDTDAAYDFCDIYTRQLQYRTKRQALRKDIDARRVSFAGPGIDARNAYFAAIKEDHARQDREKAEALAAAEAEKEVEED